MINNDMIGKLGIMSLFPQNLGHMQYPFWNFGMIM